MNVFIHVSVVAATTFMLLKRFECTATSYVGNAGMECKYTCDLL